MIVVPLEGTSIEREGPAVTTGELIGGARDGVIVRMEKIPAVLGMPVAFDDSMQWYVLSHVREDDVRIYRAVSEYEALTASIASGHL